VLVRHEYQAALAREIGADHVVFEPDANKRFVDITGARLFLGLQRSWMMLGGFDSIYDCAGSNRTITSSLRWAASRGTVVIIGVNLCPGRIDYSPVWYQEVNLLGCIGHGNEHQGNGSQSTFDLAVQMFRDSSFDVRRLITHRFGLEDLRAAVSAARDKSRSGAIKVVFDFRQ